MGGPAQPSGKVSELAHTAAVDGAHLQGARRSINCDNTPVHPLPPEALTWGVCGGLAPERGRLGPFQVRRGPTPRPGGPRRQVGGVGLPPDRHPSEVVVALAAHFAAFARDSAPSPALVRPQARARRVPEGRPDPRGRRLHAQARRDSTTSGLLSAGALLLRRLLCKCFLVPSSRDSQGRAVSLAPTPCAAAATPGLCGSRSHLTPPLQRLTWATTTRSSLDQSPASARERREFGLWSPLPLQQPPRPGPARAAA